jgi:prolyl-tRNA synthetase
VSLTKREKWSGKFGVWFRNLLINAEIMDYRYPIKGFGVWMPYGFKIRQSTFQIIRDLLEASGHEEALFPLLIPETSLEKEAEHVRSFESECFWITHGGLTPLKVKYALRPTSETVITPMFKLWIRSHADLPKKYFQVVNVYRYETKATRPIIRVREVDPFKEAHTAHATLKDAEAQVKEAVGIYAQFFDELGVPYCISRRPEWDKFAGALYTIAFDTVLPDGRTLQIGTVHNLGQNFAKAFDVTYETENGKHEFIWQTCYGISGRAIAAMLSIHGDDHGAVLPPKIAPIQVVIIPIPYKGKEETVNEACLRVASMLRDAKIRMHVDDRPEITPGSKYYDWELKGVPLRIEIGPKDVEHNQVIIVRRDNFKKQACKTEEVVSTVKSLMKEMMDEMKQKAWEWMKTHIHRVDTIEEVRNLLEKRAGIVEVLWCGSAECGHSFEETVNARVLGTPEDLKENFGGNCILCGRKATSLVRVAIAY